MLNKSQNSLRSETISNFQGRKTFIREPVGVAGRPFPVKIAGKGSHSDVFLGVFIKYFCKVISTSSCIPD